MEELTQQEIDERVAILKRFRTLLVQQRDKFREYLTVLEKQQESITAEDTESLLAHTELEQQVVAGITNIQKVLVPMSEMYASANVPAQQQENSSIESIRTELSNLQSQILVQNEKNRELLRIHISQVRTQMQQFTNPYKGKRSVYAQKNAVGNFVEIEA
ncbi:MAG TPA: flagellar biosynthesis protein FlgN [Treponema sp.]|nr:flagellar biosynthesis protein FlgN [Treponema sp.]